MLSVASLLAVLTSLRCETWRSEKALWQDAATKSPLKARPRLNLAREYQRAGDTGLALLEYTNARLLTAGGSDVDSIEIRALAASNAAVIYVEAGDLNEAAVLLAEVLRDYPGFPPAVVNMSKVLLLAGYPREAAAILTENLMARPFGPGFGGEGSLLYNRGIARAAMRDCAGAEQDFRAAHNIDASLPQSSCGEAWQ